VNAFEDLVGEVALVTGASSGIGRHFAKTLAAAGMRVAAGARRLAELESLTGEIAARGGESCVVALDVVDADSVAAAVAQIDTHWGGIDLLVNNAGVTVTGPLLEQSMADWDRVLDTNLKGAFTVSQAVVSSMRARGRGGSIVNVASILGLRQAAHVAAYAASKAGLVQLTRVMALELARDRIRVNAIAPGYIATDINRDFLATPAGEALVKRIPQRRLGEPADLDGALLLLASEAGRYITGAVLPVDGGHLVSTL
jgi:NAD(P)-dependent dehydrogenase (short-subunit alcohol dehydrogenase family)